MADVITQVIITDTRQIRANLPLQSGGETLEHTFRTNFAPGRQIALGSREVTVFVQFKGSATGQFPVLVTLTRPDGTIAAGPMEMNNRRIARGLGTPAPVADPAPVTAPAAGRAAAGTLAAAGPAATTGTGGGKPGVSFAINTGAGPKTIDTGLIDGGPGDPPPPPPDFDRLTYTIAESDPNGQWSVTITNTGQEDGIFRILIVHPGAQKTLRTSTIPISLIDRMLKTALRLAGPRLRIDRQAVISFSPEFERLTGVGPQAFGNNEDARDINLERFAVGISGAGGSVTLTAGADFEVGGKDEIDTFLVDDIDFKELGFVLDVTLGSRFSSTGGGIVNTNSRPVLVQQRDLAGQLTHEKSGRVSLEFDLTVNADASVDFFSKFLISLFGGIDVDKIDQHIRNAFNAVVLGEDGRKKISVAAEHFTDALMFLATGSRKRLFFDITSDGENIIVAHYAKPTVLDLVRPHAPGTGTQIADRPGAGSPGGVTGSTGGVVFSGAAIAAALAAPRPRFSRGVAATVPHPARGALSGANLASFLARGAPGRSGATATTALNLTGVSDLAPPTTGTVFDPALGGGASGRRIDHIVVLMMENRSFDHMLGYLSLEKGRGDVDGLTSPLENTNPVPGSQTPQGIHLLDVGNILVDPNHSHNGTLEQIAEGEMSGFIASYLKKDPAPDALDQVMGFYNDGFLNVYDRLAQEYKICNRWFCAHPGPTYPNRFISLMGATPTLNNIEIGGDLAGAVKDDTIFDILTLNGVSWKYVESNVAFLRMFDRYRTDEENIIQRKDFLKLAGAGRLPAVTWIDPNFGEIEIDNEANDDHAPADVRKGQALICEIYGALTENPAQWNRTLFIINYDEHGGFYDHVPPHGLAPDDTPPVPKVHDDGKTFYGPRVPAMLISPWVKRGSVTPKVYDHTSVLKTILVNFIGPEAATQELLGKRVDAALDLLGELEPTRRSDIPDCPDAVPVDTPTPANALAGRPIERDSFHLGMRLFPFGPKLKDLVGG